MCGRFTLKTNSGELSNEFDVHPPRDFEFESYNIAPSQTLPIIHLDQNQERQVSLMEWGLLPAWAKVIQDIPHPINARIETIGSSPMFKSSFQK
jgi:putative SOS response-associated peptidase YedK